MSKHLLLDKYTTDPSRLLIRLKVTKRKNEEGEEEETRDAAPAAKDLFSVGKDVLRYVILKDIGWTECVLLRQVSRAFRDIIEPVMLKLAVAEFNNVRAYHVERYGVTLLNGAACRIAHNYCDFLRNQCAPRLLLVEACEVFPLKRTDIAPFGLEKDDMRMYSFNELFIVSLKLCKTVDGMIKQRKVLHSQRAKQREARARYDQAKREREQREAALEEEQKRQEKVKEEKELMVQRNMRMEQLNAVLIGFGCRTIEHVQQKLSPGCREKVLRISRVAERDVSPTFVEQTAMEIVSEINMQHWGQHKRARTDPSPEELLFGDFGFQ